MLLIEFNSISNLGRASARDYTVEHIFIFEMIDLFIFFNNPQESIC